MRRTEDGQWERVVFPTARASRKEDVLLMRRWLAEMTEMMAIQLPLAVSEEEKKKGGGGRRGCLFLILPRLTQGR